MFRFAQRRRYYFRVSAVLLLLSVGAMVVTTAVFRDIGPFDETLRVGEFVDWYARAEEAGLATLMLDEVVLQRRIHAGHLNQPPIDVRRDFARLLKARIDRTRKSRS